MISRVEYPTYFSELFPVLVKLRSLDTTSVIVSGGRGEIKPGGSYGAFFIVSHDYSELSVA